MKDKNNLLNYNSWSAGEYNESPQTTVNGAGQETITIKKYATIGENSFEIIKTSDSGVWTEWRANTNISSFKASCDIYSPTTNGTLNIIIHYTDNTESSQYIWFSHNNKILKLSVYANATNGKTVSRVSLRIVLTSKNIPLFVDNLKIESN